MIQGIMLSLLTGLISGVIAGLIVYWTVALAERKKWSSAKTQLVTFLNHDLNALLTTLRAFIDIEPPLIGNEKDYLEYCKSVIFENLEDHRRQIEYPNSDHTKILFSNLNSINNSLGHLGPLFVGFRAADPWYIEVILNLFDRMQGVTVPYYTFPEICMREHDSDERINAYRKIAYKEIKELFGYIIETRSNSKIAGVANLIDFVNKNG
jgi:hypothetical protein